MKLITKQILDTLPQLESNSDKSQSELKFFVKLFTPWTNWTWYIAEYNPLSGECFGLVHGFEKELGYFNLNEIAELRGIGGLKVERDRFFEPTMFNDIK
jgi:hypothetical protein